MNTYTASNVGINESLLITRKDGFDINVKFYDEESNPEDYFDDQVDIHNIWSGKACWLIMEVTASKKGIELGSASIGACSYINMDDIVAANSYYTDLIEEAIAEAKHNLKELLK